jgi:HlyD family secretion protein
MNTSDAEKNTPKKPSIFEASDKRRNQIKADRPKNQTAIFMVIFASLFLLIAIPILIFYPKTQLFNLKNYSVSMIEKMNIPETETASGKLIPEKIINFPVPTNGNLVEMNISVGKQIKKGGILAIINSKDLGNQIKISQTSLFQAKDSLQQAIIRNKTEIENKISDIKILTEKEKQLKSDLDLTLKLFKLGGAAQVEVKKNQNDLNINHNDLIKNQNSLKDMQKIQALSVEALQRTVQDANESLLQAKQNMAKAVIRASVDGQVLTVKAAQGDDVRLGDLLFTIADTRKMRIDADVDEATAARIKVGQPVNILIGETTFKGEISQVAPQANTGQNGSSVPIQVQFLGTVPKLRPNISASLEILLNVKKDVLSLPRAPFLTTGGERLVYVITAADTAERREVVFGVSNAERVEVVSGLQLGDKVITSSMEAYKDQLKIQISPTGALK